LSYHLGVHPRWAVGSIPVSRTTIRACESLFLVKIQGLAPHGYPSVCSARVNFPARKVITMNRHHDIADPAGALDVREWSLDGGTARAFTVNTRVLRTAAV
jgi:hypothetical protein